jgi:hypothetical protein
MMDKHCLRELSLLTAFYKKNRSHDLNSSPLAHDQLNPNQLDLECNMFKHDACISQDAQVSKPCNQATVSSIYGYLFEYSMQKCFFHI